MTTTTRVFTGHHGASYGIDSRVTVVPPVESGSWPSPNRVDVPSGASFMAAPLLTLHDTPSISLILVGRCHVLVKDHRPPEITVIVEEMWVAASYHSSNASEASGTRGWQTQPDHPDLHGAVDAALARPGHLDPGSSIWRAVTVAKAIAEHSRQAVSQIRDLRYQAERDFGSRLRGRHGWREHLSDLVELSIAASRARDLCSEGTREGLWVWRTDKDAYHAHRRQLDSTLAPRKRIRRPASQPWFVTLDASVRQCREADVQLRDEVTQLHQLLAAASTISVAKDAEAQEQFNFVATVGAVTLGLPALVLGVYGAGAAPDFGRQVWVVPFILCGIFSIVVAAWLSRHPKRFRGAGLTMLAALATVGIAELAAWVAH